MDRRLRSLTFSAAAVERLIRHSQENPTQRQLLWEQRVEMYDEEDAWGDGPLTPEMERDRDAGRWPAGLWLLVDKQARLVANTEREGDPPPVCPDGLGPGSKPLDGEEEIAEFIDLEGLDVPELREPGAFVQIEISETEIAVGVGV